MSQHGSQEGSQEASKIDQQIVKNRLSFGLALGRPSGPQKVIPNWSKILSNWSKFLCFSLVASSIFHYMFSRFSEIQRASRSLAKTGLC